MQPIERYGLVALLFLVVTVVAVVLWDRKKDKHTLEQPPLVATAPVDAAGAGAAGAGGNGSIDGWNTPIGAQSPWTSQQSEVQPFVQNGTTQQPGVAGEVGTSSGSSAAQSGGSAGSGGGPAVAGSGSTLAGGGTGEPLGGGAFLQAAPSARNYTIKKGDTLSAIAKRELGAASRHVEIAALNPGLNPNRIKEGTTIQLPAGKSEPLAAAAPAAKGTSSIKPAPASGLGYTIRHGDSLWTIAESQLGDGDRYTEIAALNPGLNANKLVVGAKLRLPASTSRKPQEKVAGTGARKGGVL